MIRHQTGSQGREKRKEDYRSFPAGMTYKPSHNRRSALKFSPVQTLQGQVIAVHSPNTSEMGPAQPVSSDMINRKGMCSVSHPTSLLIRAASHKQPAAPSAASWEATLLSLKLRLSCCSREEEKKGADTSLFHVTCLCPCPCTARSSHPVDNTR